MLQRSKTRQPVATARFRQSLPEMLYNFGVPMTDPFDSLETRSADARHADQFAQLRAQVDLARTLPGYGERLKDVDPRGLTDRTALARLPVLRKSSLAEAQSLAPPFGGFAARGPSGFAHVFQSPGPIYEPGQVTHDWWRMGRFLHALGIGRGDVVQNCFSYHMTPAGMIFENAARAVGATVFPAGTGQTELQVQAAAAIGATAYAGTPDYLKVILDAAEAEGVALGFTRAAVGGGALFPSMRQGYADRGILCLQSYATADVGNIAYESPAQEGMIVDEGVIVEIVRPGTGDPVAEGEVGEVVVTLLTPDYPLIRFATGDLSAIFPGESPCGRTNMRIRGWMGRADQTTKVKGMFIRPEQVAAVVARHDGVLKARATVTRKGAADVLTFAVEAGGVEGSSPAGPAEIARTVREVTKLKATVEVHPRGSLPNDGKVIDDQRQYDT
jgi:phenylacetate-CoA ligase